MDFPPNLSLRRRRLAELSLRITEICGDITGLEREMERLAAAAQRAQGGPSVDELRIRLTGEGLATKRAQLADLTERGRVIEVDIAERPSGTFPALGELLKAVEGGQPGPAPSEPAQSEPPLIELSLSEPAPSEPALMGPAVAEMEGGRPEGGEETGELSPEAPIGATQRPAQLIEQEQPLERSLLLDQERPLEGSLPEASRGEDRVEPEPSLRPALEPVEPRRGLTLLLSGGLVLALLAVLVALVLATRSLQGAPIGQPAAAEFRATSPSALSSATPVATEGLAVEPLAPAALLTDLQPAAELDGEAEREG